MGCLVPGISTGLFASRFRTLRGMLNYWICFNDTISSPIAITKVLSKRNGLNAVSIACSVPCRPVSECAPVLALTKLTVTCGIIAKTVERRVVGIALDGLLESQLESQGPMVDAV